MGIKLYNHWVNRKALHRIGTYISIGKDDCMYLAYFYNSPILCQRPLLVSCWWNPVKRWVLFSQMVTLQFPGLGYSSWVPYFPDMISNFYRQYFLSIPLTVYSIWNLNFLNLDPVPFCIPHIDTAAKAILLQYTTAACPLVFIVVTYTWIKCYNNGYRLVVYTTRPVHQLLARFWQKFKIQPSLIDTYAGLMLLSYMRFLGSSGWGNNHSRHTDCKAGYVGAVIFFTHIGSVRYS